MHIIIMVLAMHGIQYFCSLAYTCREKFKKVLRADANDIF